MIGLSIPDEVLEIVPRLDVGISSLYENAPVVRESLVLVKYVQYFSRYSVNNIREVRTDMQTDS